MSQPPVADDPADEQSGSGGLLRSTSTVGAMTVLSRISGLARDIVFSGIFGASGRMDIFVFAFRLPNMLRRFFAEGAFAQAFVPVIAEYRSARSKAEVRELIARTSGTLAVILFAITAVGVVAAPVVVLVLGTGIVTSGGPVDLATDMVRLAFPYIFFISLTAMAGSVLNTYGRFAVPAFTPVLLNIVLISSALIIAPRLEEPVLALAIGVFVAGIAQLLFQLPFLARAGLLPMPRLGFKHPGVVRIRTLMLPVLFGASVAQINILFDTYIALFLAEGSVAWLYYSDRLIEFPLGVFGIALATVILPSLSSHHARQSESEFTSTLDWALRCVLLIGVPAAVALLVLAEPLIATLFYGGAFDSADLAMSAASLRAYAPGLMGFILVKVLVNGFFARQDPKTPVRIAVKALLFGMLLNIVFVLFLVWSEWAPGHVGLAAATAVSSLTNATLLFRALRAEGIYRPASGWAKLFLRVGLATLAMTAFLFLVLGFTGDWAEMPRVARIAWLAALVAGGAGIYFVFALAAGLRVGEFRLRS